MKHMGLHSVLRDVHRALEPVQETLRLLPRTEDPFKIEVDKEGLIWYFYALCNGIGINRFPMDARESGGIG